jgi:hypothetical protein
MPLDQKLKCKSGKDIFNQEVQQQWQQTEHDTSAEEFAQNWNLLCNLQSPARSKMDHGNLIYDQYDLDDIEDFLEDDTDFEKEVFEALEHENDLKRKQISLCRHKLQRRANPRCRNRKKTQ